MIMKENLLQFIWKWGLFKSDNLQTIQNQSIQIINKGMQNTNAGPDFLNARISVDNTIWAGNVELHILSSDYLKHNHQSDPKYKNIILHVVYQHDETISVLENTPTLALHTYINHDLIANYERLMNSPQKLPCQDNLQHVASLSFTAWLERMLIEKWETKMSAWQATLQQSNNDWQTLLYQQLAYNFGFKINSTAFHQLAVQTPLAILLKNRDSLMHIEAILFGQSGLIPSLPQDEYTRALQIHYEFYKHKYKLQPIAVSLWNHLRLRPANFPSIRIAQFAKIIHEKRSVFNKFLEVQKMDQTEIFMDIQVSTYWETHYQFDMPSKKQSKKLGKDAINNIIINTIAPMQWFYYKTMGNHDQMQQAIELLEKIPAEKNNIIEIWQQLPYPIKTAADSQALIYLYQQYCSLKKCLQCNIGLQILKHLFRNLILHANKIPTCKATL